MSLESLESKDWKNFDSFNMESSSGRKYTNEQIVKVLDQYERKLKSMNKFYVNKYNTDEEFRQKKLQKSRENYHKNKEYQGCRLL